jgi:malate dehydrogenase
VDNAPAIEVAIEPSVAHADLVVMLAGVTIATDSNTSVDRVALGHINRKIFVEYADALAARPGLPPVVIVQSNPVKLGVQIFAGRLGR